ncbi:MAG: amidase, partial [Acidobacteriaceae bacterium]
VPHPSRVVCGKGGRKLVHSNRAGSLTLSCLVDLDSAAAATASIIYGEVSPAFRADPAGACTSVQYCDGEDEGGKLSALTLQSAVAQLALLVEGKISPLELAEEHIREIERLNPLLNAITDFGADRVRSQARALMASSAPRGPLFGLPVTVKSSIGVAGLRCELGSLLRKGMVAQQDAVVVSRLRRAGANILGSTNCPEFLMAYETDNRLYGSTKNPWNLGRTPGGSSGGEAAAIASGMSAAGLGSDSGGSVRAPAHFTGICALKPTPGRVPATGHLPPCAGPFSILGAIGPMARSIEDVGLLFRTVAGQDPSDPVGVPLTPRIPSSNQLRQIPIGYFEDDGIVPVTQETREAVRSAARVLEENGFRVEWFRPKALERARQLWWKFFVRGGAMFLGPILRGKHDRLSPVLLEFLSIAQREPPLTGDELLQAWAECDQVRSELLAEMQQFPVLLCPVCAVPAFGHGERSWTVEGQTVDYLDAMRYTQWFNLLAAPAAVVPVGKSREGLPIGVQVVARPFEDETALAIANVIDREFGFTAPPGISR